MTHSKLTSWAETMREIFRAETISQFILTGNIHDLVPFNGNDGNVFMPLKTYLADVVFSSFDVVIFYDRGKGLRVAKGESNFELFLQHIHLSSHSKFSKGLLSDAGFTGKLPLKGLQFVSPLQAFEVIDRFLVTVANAKPASSLPQSAAVIVNYANFVVPKGESIHLTGEIGANLVKILDWAENPAITGANIVTVLISETLSDLSDYIVDSPYTAKIPIPLPDQMDIIEFLDSLFNDNTEYKSVCRLEKQNLAGKLAGLSRIDIKNVLLRAIKNDQPVDSDYLTKARKKLIEGSLSGRLQFIESSSKLEQVAGHDSAKQWLREDARLMRHGKFNALPMGYLIVGRIGIGKSFLVECFAGECGVPCVTLKNFREKWVGSTEKNLEKVFHILKALGQVVVFIDEADQIAGRRTQGDSDSGVSGRIYGMLAKEMANTQNRGKILWIFATSRPDLLEADMKRQGRLDVHIPLFPVTSETDQRDLLFSIAKKNKIALRKSDIPPLKFSKPVSGSDLEGLLIRSVRAHEIARYQGKKRTIKEILKVMVEEFTPPVHMRELELMDLLAVKECTDRQFLPDAFASLNTESIDQKIQDLLLFE
ncbi:ATP-binding protein [bacterium]|nr:ATP-binding protein [candidate division CSSED10-310 bacterium]